MTPYSPIPVDLNTPKKVFVDGFPNSTSRQLHFERYGELNARLLQLIPTGFKQWVDGSFVSRKLNPNDIDVLTFVDTALYDQHERTLQQIRNEFATGAGQVDVQLIRVYPDGHRYRNLYELDQLQWLFDWSRTRNRPRRNKGFIEPRGRPRHNWLNYANRRHFRRPPYYPAGADQFNC